MERPYQSAIRDAKAKLGHLAEERDRIEGEIARYESIVKALAQSIEDRTEREKLLAEVELLVKAEGFTDAIRRILRDSRSTPPLTPPEIRDQMVKDGFNLGAYGSPLASIHAILTRLRRKGQVKRMVRGDHTTYLWIGK
jgi:hypothetical protein